jgi:UDP-N-acetylmuramoylalanine--D-glutamate ligase
MQLFGKKIWIIGMARSGIAAANVLHAKGARVIISDGKEREDFDSNVIDSLLIKGVELRFKDDLAALPNDISLTVISPGLSIYHPVVAKLRERGIEVISEIELAYRLNPQIPIIAITGTNGKTTTTSLIGQILRNGGRNAKIAGNIGIPLVQEIANIDSNGIIAAEISSFQLEAIDKFTPHIAVLLNITPDHLDRHGTMEKYIETKGFLFQNQSKTDFAILNRDDENVVSLAYAVPSEIIWFSRQQELDEGIFIRDGKIVIRYQGLEYIIIEPQKIRIKGAHNLENSMAAIGAAFAAKVSINTIRDTLISFKGVEHRLEVVREIDGVLFINDSKGTNTDAAIKALDAYPNPIVLIAGGKDKGTSFASFARKIKERVKELILIGQAAPIIEAEVRKEGFFNIHHCKTMEDAVRRADELAEKGDIVLLSPACASFDMFRNYEERGAVFKNAVNKLRRD